MILKNIFEETAKEINMNDSFLWSEISRHSMEINQNSNKIHKNSMEINELQATNESLETEVEVLKKEVERLKSGLDIVMMYLLEQIEKTNENENKIL